MFNLFFIIIIMLYACFCIYTFYKMNKNHKEDEINFEIDKLNIIFAPIIQAKPYITIRLLEKSYKNKYIKFGVTMTSEGVADALMDDSPLDLLNNRLKSYCEIEYKINSNFYNVELVLIES